MFDIEHTFRMLKQTLGWTRPRRRDSAAADRWTWLILAAHTQLRLARPSPPTSAGRGETGAAAQTHPRPGPARVPEPSDWVRGHRP